MIMNQQVIEAATGAANDVWDSWRALGQGGPATGRELKRVQGQAMASAITAADTARAPAILAALARLETALHQLAGASLCGLGGPRGLLAAKNEVTAARGELLVACGVDATEGE